MPPLRQTHQKTRQTREKVRIDMKERCTAEIEIEGTRCRCQRKVGDGHRSNDTMHEVDIPDPSGCSGVTVRWLSYRKVAPPRVAPGYIDATLIEASNARIQ